MPKSPRNRLLYIIVSVLLVIVAGAGIFALWLSHHYKQILVERLPVMMQKSTDSVYHLSFKDISVNVFTRNVTITDLKLWPDKKQVRALKLQRRHTPTTLSTVSIPLLEASGIAWRDIIDEHAVDCEQVTVHGLKWLMVCAPHPEDSLYERDKQGKPYLSCIRASHADFDNPNVTYHYEGRKDSFYFFMKGGTANLNKFIYNFDERKDTSLFIYAGNGKVRFDSIIFLKKDGRYTMKRPDVDFETGPRSVTLKEVRIRQMVDHDPVNGNEKEIYDIHFPFIQLMDFNWNKLINDNTLQATEVNASEPNIAIRYIDKNASKVKRMGSYPHQLLLQAGLQTNLEVVNIKNGHFKYTEVTEKNDEAVIDITHIHGRFANVTNMKDIIARHKDCVIKLEGKYMDKSDVSSTFNFYLGDTTGRFSMDGVIKNMEGDEVAKQAQVFTFVAVTSFHLSKMDMHIEGDETYAHGNFTVLYENLKISLFKFKSKYRKGKHGPFAFLGSTLVLYPSNPVKDNGPRTVTTSFARDTTKGFIPLLWQNIYRAVKKTAVRDQNIVVLTDGRESGKGEQPKKGFLKRLFGKKK